MIFLSPVDGRGQLLITDIPRESDGTMTEKYKNLHNSENVKKQPTLAYCCSLRIHMLVEGLGIGCGPVLEKGREHW